MPSTLPSASGTQVYRAAIRAASPLDLPEGLEHRPPGGVAQAGPVLVHPANGEVRRVAVVLRRVPEAPKVAAVEADLCDLRPRVLDELEVARVRVLVPVGDEPRELEARRVRRAARRGGESQEANGQE